MKNIYPYTRTAADVYLSRLREGIDADEQAVRLVLLPSGRAGRSAERVFTHKFFSLTMARLLGQQQLLDYLQFPHFAHFEEARVSLRIHNMGENLEVHQSLSAVLEAHHQLGGTGALTPRLLTGRVKPIYLTNLRSRMDENEEGI